MKKILLLITLFSFSFAIAQFNQDAPWMKDLNAENRGQSLQFDDIVEAFDAYWKTRDPNVKGSGFKPFKRWETYWSHFVKEDGTLPSSQEFWNSWEQKQSNSAARMADESNWQAVGPFTHTNTGSWSSGQGRINAVIVDPNNTANGTNIVYAGAPAGGIWQSLDGGATWKVLTDHLPQIGVSGIAIDYNDSDIIYIATGDDDAGNSFSVGVWKSIDGGTTWNATGLNPNNSPSRMNDIYIHPTNSSILWVATNAGVYKSTDAGANWTNTQGGNIRDIKVKPTDPSVLYAVSSNAFFKSEDGGDSFTATGVGTNLPSASSRLVIDVTPANPEIVYVLSAANDRSFQGIYKSTNSGVVFTETASNATVGNIFESNQSWYDMAFAVSDQNENELYTGVLNIWKSDTGGTIMTKVNNWNQPASPSYSHADIHLLRFFNGDLYAGTDGGIYKTSNTGVNFTDLTGGMQIGQFYRIAVSKQSSDNMVGGLQDNGGYSFNNDQWQNYYGADGMDTAIDPGDSNLHYGFLQFGGALNISTSAGGSLNGQVGAPTAETDPPNGDSGGNWITPLVMNSDGELYAAYSRLYRLDGTTWTSISINFNADVDVLEIDENNTDNIFVGVDGLLRRSTDKGVVFSIVESFPANITSIEVNNSDSNIIYVTTSGLGGRVYRSLDQGDTFAEITGSLPAVTKNIIKHQGQSADNPLYLGTHLGVYRYDDITGDWEVFENNLPNVSVRDLEINLNDQIVTVATYGRGVWQSPLAPTSLADDDVALIQVEGVNSTFIACGDVFPKLVVKNNGANTINSIDITYTVDGGTPDAFTWNGTLASLEQTTIDLPTLNLDRGIHQFVASANIANDQFSNNNNSSNLTFSVNDNGIAQQVNTFETANDELIAYNEGTTTVMWQRGVPTGTDLNTATSGTSVYGTNLSGNHADATKGFLISQCYDLTTVPNPILKFNMAFEIEQDFDLVYVQYSTDNGNNWNLLGSANDPNWYNSSRFGGDGVADDCQNCVGGQWTGTNTTMTEYSKDLSALSTESSIMFRFVFHSDPNTNAEGAIIDDFIIDGTSPDDDNDGIPNTADNCPSVANADQLDTDNDGMGDVCDTDDDNDGVLDATDNCSLTANADQADDNNDGIGNVCDTDNDTILNDDDNCPDNPNTDQADFDNDGIGDACDDDIDNDGVLNVNDNCNDTPTGDIVDASGCTVFILPTDNFQLLITGETCRTSNNGSIEITANESHNYTAQLTGNGLDISNDFTATTEFANLEAGNYMICITIAAQPDYELCYNVTIVEPEDLSVFSRIDTEAGRISLELNGSTVYHIELNGVVTTTSDSDIVLDLAQGVNVLKVSTDKDCQGIYTETIQNFDTIKIYPNPVNGDILTINTSNSILEALDVKLYSLVGQVILSKTFNLQNGAVTIDMSKVSQGVYILDVNDGSVTKNFKVIKK